LPDRLREPVPYGILVLPLLVMPVVGIASLALFNRPKKLVPTRYRHKPGLLEEVSQRLSRHERRDRGTSDQL
jgi:hypothetical protein